MDSNIHKYYINIIYLRINKPYQYSVLSILAYLLMWICVTLYIGSYKYKYILYLNWSYTIIHLCLTA